MKPQTAQKLIQLNLEFYQTFAADFSATRQRIQPGVMQIVEAIPLNSAILDLGCGNGVFASELYGRGFSGEYLGLDFSLELIQIAEGQKIPHASFRAVDLLVDDWSSELEENSFDYVLCFAAMHHSPWAEIRQRFLNKVRGLLAPKGRFVHSHWQFLNSPKLRNRLQDWEQIGLTEEDVDEHDYLMDWRRGGKGLRYVHHFSQSELHHLAHQTNFKVSAMFMSDGEMGDLGLYQIWEAV